jgi:hypothetical protein
VTARLRGAGLLVAAAYLAVAAATHSLVPGVRAPLFDGFAPPPPYRWVKPPPELAAGNQPPEPADRTIPLSATGSAATNASTTDAQIIVSLPDGAIPAHDADTSIAMHIAPLDAGTLGPLPPKLRVVSNAYQVTMAYQPSNTPVTQVASSATIALTASSQGDTLLYSTDGRTWQQPASRPFGATHGLVGTFTASGYYLVTASPAVTTTTVAGTKKAGGGAGAVVGIALLAAIPVAILVAGAVRSRNRRRRARTRQQRRRETRRR